MYGRDGGWGRMDGRVGGRRASIFKKPAETCALEATKIGSLFGG